MTPMRWTIVILAAMCVAAAGSGSAPPAATAPATKPAAGDAGQGDFVAIDVTLQPTSQGLGSYQLEVTAPEGARLVGVEGGEGSFSAAPFYDLAALEQRRVIIAAIAEPVYASSSPASVAPTDDASRPASRGPARGSPSTTPAPASPGGAVSPAPAGQPVALPAAPPLRVARLHFYLPVKPANGLGVAANVVVAGDPNADRLDPLPRADLKRAIPPGE